MSLPSVPAAKFLFCRYHDPERGCWKLACGSSRSTDRCAAPTHGDVEASVDASLTTQ